MSKQKVSFYSVIDNIKNITFNFSNTLRGEDITLEQIPGDFIIDVNGFIFKMNEVKASAIVTIIGGYETHAYTKAKVSPYGYYINDHQKHTVQDIIRYLSLTNRFDGKINNGNNEYLNIMTQSLFENFRG